MKGTCIFRAALDPSAPALLNRATIALADNADSDADNPGHN